MPEQPENEEQAVDQALEGPKPSRLLPAEHEKIWQLYFVEGLSQEAIVKKVGRCKQAVNRSVNSADAIVFKKRVAEEMQARVQQRMAMLSERALKSWERQLDLADQGLKAQHLPAKELLTHARTVEVAAPNTDRRTQVLIQIGGDHSEDVKIIEAETPDAD